MKRAFVTALLPIISVLIVGCGSEEAKEPLESITIGAYLGPTDALVWIAQDQGFFNENGLDVTIKEYAAGKLSVDALLAGDVDLATSAEFVMVSNSFDHDDLRIVGILTEADVHEVVARRDRGINQPTDLRGKKIGVTQKSGAEFTLGRFLTSIGIALEEVELVDLAPHQLMDAISQGEVDAVNTWEPNVFEIKKRLGAEAIGWSPQGDRALFWLLIGKEKQLKERPSAFASFLKAIVQAEQFVKANPQKSQNIVTRRVNLELSFVQYIWPRLVHKVGFEQALLIAMEDEARWRIANNLTDKTEIPNYLNSLYLNAMESVKPDSVMIIR